MKKAIIILHGWGLTGSKYKDLVNLLTKSGYDVYAPDLPGFGSEPLTKKAMNVDDYLDFVINFIKKKKLKSVILIGHSFGGRVAIKYTYLYPDNVSELILTGVPVIRDMSIKKKINFLFGYSWRKVIYIPTLFD